MRLIAIAALLALAVGSQAVASSAADLTKLHEQVIAPSVFVEMIGLGSCSGQVFWSDRDQKSGDVTTYVLTAKHCVADTTGGTPIKVSFPTYDTDLAETGAVVYNAVVDEQSWKADVAVLVLEDKQTHFDQLAKLAGPEVKLVEGEDAWTVGYPLGYSRTVTRGMVGTATSLDASAIGGPEKLTNFLRATPDITNGSSGGAVYHQNASGDYELIGTATAKPGSNTFMGIYTGFGQIDDFLKSQYPKIFNALFPNAKEKAEESYLYFGGAH